MYPWIESAHVLFIAIFFGTLLFVDLRLTGYGFKELVHLADECKNLAINYYWLCIDVNYRSFLLFYALPIRNYRIFSLE